MFKEYVLHFFVCLGLICAVAMIVVVVNTLLDKRPPVCPQQPAPTWRHA